jgi:CheY-like chemotaxis protein
VLGACDGAMALALAHFLPPDLFLCDLCMPEVGGLEAIRQFHAAFPRIPVVAMSGAAPGGPLDRLAVASAEGAAGALNKPFRLGSLLALVDEVLRGATTAYAPGAAC